MNNFANLLPCFIEPLKKKKNKNKREKQYTSVVKTVMTSYVVPALDYANSEIGRAQKKKL